MNAWLHISNLGDVVPMGFAAVAIAAVLLFGRAWRAAWSWCILIGMGMVLVVASKIGFLAWGWGICSLDFTGFSGHATRAMAIVPVLFHLMLNRASSVRQRAGLLLGVAFGLVIGVSRLALHVHSVFEVVTGWLLGGGIALLFVWSNEKLPVFELRKYAALSGVLILTLLPATEAGATQRILSEVALFLSGHERTYSLRDCGAITFQAESYLSNIGFPTKPVIMIANSRGGRVNALQYSPEVLV